MESAGWLRAAIAQTPHNGAGPAIAAATQAASNRAERGRRACHANNTAMTVVAAIAMAPMASDQPHSRRCAQGLSATLVTALATDHERINSPSRCVTAMPA